MIRLYMSSPLFLLLELLLAALAAPAEPAGCPTKCGDVDIPYPFGIGTGCSRSTGFEISCVDNGNKAVLPATTEMIQVISLSVAPQPEAKVMLPVAYQCYNLRGNTIRSFDGTVDVKAHGVYRISDTRNKFVVLGCNTGAYTRNSDSNGTGSYFAGCFAYCEDLASVKNGECSSVGCCEVHILPGLTDNVVNFEDWEHSNMAYSPCDYAFLVDKDNYTFKVSDLHMDEKPRNMPVWLDWAIRDDGAPSCAAAMNRTDYACASAHSECVNSDNGPGYFCRCKKGFEGNPYKPGNGCANINECTRPNEYPCYGVCKDVEGSYRCMCRPGFRTINGDPKTEKCIPRFPREAQLALGISLGMLVLAVALLFTPGPVMRF